MRIYLRMLRYLWPYKGLILVHVLFIVLHMIFSLVNFTIIIPLLDVLFNQVDTSPTASEELPPFDISVDYIKMLFAKVFGIVIADYGRWGAMQFICLVLITSVLLASVFRYLALVLLVTARVRALQDLRQQLFHRVIYLPVRFFTSQKKGDTLSRFSNDLAEVDGNIFNSFKEMLKAPIMIAGYFAILFSMSLKLSLITLFILPLSGACISLIIKRLRKRAQQQHASMGLLTSILEESLHAMPIIKSFTAENYVLGKFGNELRRYIRLNLSITRRIESVAPLSELLATCVVCLLLLVGSYFILHQEDALTASEFIAFLLIFSQVLNPFKALTTGFSSIQKGLAAGERIMSLLHAPNTLIEDEHPLSVTHFRKNIAFEGVSFSYGEKPVLENIHLQIEKEKIIALVGPSGAGKSTLSYLIPRFYDVSTGHILLDGHPITRYRVKDLRSLIGIVAQEVILFHDTIFQNIAFGKPKATPTEIERAARIANAHDFIIAHPHQYETIIGEGGLKLSGGQRQRINIARAMVKDPPILILDEATSALDSASERLVQEALQKIMKKRTCLIIAHRLSTIQHADEIIVLEQGRIIERGNHSTLLKKKGAYKKLIDMQSFH